MEEKEILTVREMKAKRERNLFGAKKRHLLIIIYIKVFYEKEGYIFIIFIHRRCKKACHTDKKSSLLSRFHSKLVRKQDQCLYPSKETFIWQLYPSIQGVFPYSSSPPMCAFAPQLSFSLNISTN